MKKTFRVGVALISFLFHSDFGHAQEFAPSSLTGQMLSMTITAGQSPFASAGFGAWFTSAAGSNYLTLGSSAGGLSAGTYALNQTASNRLTLLLDDAQTGPGASLQLSFVSSNSGSYALTNGSAWQTGAFISTNFFTPAQPDIFLPSATNAGKFQAFVAGQNGLQYSIDSSPDLTTWTSATLVSVTNLTQPFLEDATGAGRFYRAHAIASSFAPASVTNCAFNMTVAAGSGSFAAAGTLQWLPDSAGDGYAISGVAGVSDSSGTYVYSKTANDAGAVTGIDSAHGAFGEKFIFTSPATGWFYATNGGGFQSGTFTMGGRSLVFAGHVRFAPDTGRGASGYFSATTNALDLSVTDAAGYIWTLRLPADALPGPETITMTPFTNIDSSLSLLTVTSGVQFGPDGLRFADAATLTVTAPAALGTNVSLLIAGNDGSNLEFAPSTNQANTYSATLLHFSASALGNLSPAQFQQFQEEHGDAWVAAYDDALKEVQALNHQVVIPPPPPDHDFTCQNEDSQSLSGQYSAYYFTVFAAEHAAFENLLSLAAGLDKLNGGHGDPIEQAASQAILDVVQNEMADKVDFLLSYYRGDRKKFAAVANVALCVNNEDATYGGSGDLREWRSTLADWAKDIQGYYFGQLISQHDYSAVDIILSLESDYINLSGDAADDDRIFARLRDALTFQMTVDIVMTGTISAEAKCVSDLAYDAALTTLQSSGNARYISGSGPQVQLVLPQSFSQSAVALNFDACNNGTANIYLSCFGSSSESWTADGHAFPPPNFLENYAETAYSIYQHHGKTYDGWFDFVVALDNKNAEAVNQTFDDTASASKERCVLTITLEHTPK